MKGLLLRLNALTCLVAVTAIVPVVSDPASEKLPTSDSDVELYTLPPLVLPDARQFSAHPPKDEPLVLALPNVVSITPDTHGNWDTAADGTRVWRLHVVAPRATGAVVGITRYHMPEGGSLYLYSTDRTLMLPPFTSEHNNPSGELWLPLVPTNDLILEVNLSLNITVEPLELEIGAINSGFRSISDASPDNGRDLRSGKCNVDVSCSMANAWRDEIRSVAVYGYGGRGENYLACTGTMLNNVRQDKKNYFLTANHCISSQSRASSVTVYWNYETSTCGRSTPNGSLRQFTTGGAKLRATHRASDFTLLELNSSPDPSFGVTYAGWDRRGKEATSAVCIHHPQTSEKRISFENSPTTTTDYLEYSVRSNSNFYRVRDWDTGTTEPGSSGAPLFNQDKRVIGQLFGGYAACGNDLSDWYGKFSKSWDEGSSSFSRLRDWLDPDDKRPLTLDLLDSRASIPTPPTKAPTVVSTCTSNPKWYWINRRGKVKRCSWALQAKTAKQFAKRCGRNGFLAGARVRASVACPAECNPGCSSTN